MVEMPNAPVQQLLFRSGCSLSDGAEVSVLVVDGTQLVAEVSLVRLRSTVRGHPCAGVGLGPQAACVAVANMLSQRCRLPSPATDEA